MALPAAAIPALISAGGSTANNFLNMGASWIRNRNQRRFTEHMYNRQYQDSIRFWNMQNEYNSPANQAARMEAAGFNKLLPFLKGGSGTQPAAPLSPPKSLNMDYKQPTFDLGIDNALSHMYSFEQKRAGIDNMKAQTTATLAAAALTGVKSIREQKGVEKDEIALKYLDQIQQNTLESLTASINKVNAETKYTLDRNDREQIMNSHNAAQAVENIALTKARQKLTGSELKHVEEKIKLARKEGVLKNWHIRLSEKNMTDRDNILYRTVGTILENMLHEIGYGWLLDGVNPHNNRRIPAPK